MGSAGPLCVLLAGCAGAPGSGGLMPAVTGAFLPEDGEPDTLKVLPPPPPTGSAAFAADRAAFLHTRALRDSPRWAVASADAQWQFPAAPTAFSCALGVPIEPRTTPVIFGLMQRTQADANAATSGAKSHYRRRRPFVYYRQGTCLPRDEAFLRHNGSYPSGHTTWGWTWALTLAAIAPDRTDPLLARGHAYGQSRVVCGAHWQSDVTAGFLAGAAVFARLQAEPQFRRQLDAARAELARVRARGLKPNQDCTAEAAALAFGPAPPAPPGGGQIGADRR